MSEAKFTKGEWCKSESRGEVSVYSSKELESTEVCVVGYGKKALANANLIVAAPDLYRRLERIRTILVCTVNKIEVTDSNSEEIKMINHEISLIDNELAKARGE